MANRGLGTNLALVCLLASLGLEAAPCYAKAIIRQWSPETPPMPTPTPFPTPNPAALAPRYYTPAPVPTPVAPIPRATPRPLAMDASARTALGIALAYYGSKPGVFAKGCFGTYALSSLLSIRTGVLTGNTPIPVPTSANLYEYSSFFRVPVGLVAKWHFLYGGLQVSRTWIDTYNQTGYAVTSFEPLLGMAFEPGPFYLSLDASYPPFDLAVPLVVSLSIGGRF